MKGATTMTWEELEDCGELDRRLQRIVHRPTKYQTQSCQSVSILSRPEDASRNASTQPVKILKRQPVSDPCLASSDNQCGAQSQPVRTLEERKAAYAAARLRILGSAAESNTPTTTTTTRTSKKSPKQPARAHNAKSLTNGVNDRR